MNEKLKILENLSKVPAPTTFEELVELGDHEQLRFEYIHAELQVIRNALYYLIENQQGRGK